MEGPQYAVTPDGQRFLLWMPTGRTSIPPTTMIVNWASAVRKR